MVGQHQDAWHRRNQVDYQYRADRHRHRLGADGVWGLAGSAGREGSQALGMIQKPFRLAVWKWRFSVWKLGHFRLFGWKESNGLTHGSFVMLFWIVTYLKTN